MREPQAELQQKEGAAMNSVFSELVSKEEEAGMTTPSGTKTAQWRKTTEIVTKAIKPVPADPGTPMKRTWSAKKGEVKKECKQTLHPVK
jgi:hypothetical protein